MASEDPDFKLPYGWVLRESKSRPGTIYYFNEYSRVSRWEKPTEEDKPDKVRCSHILLKYDGSRNPVSRRTNQPVTRTAQEAIQGLEEMQKQLQSNPEVFGELAEKNSDCSSFKRKGDLGSFGEGEMQPSFSRAAFALAVGEISGIIQSDSGFHLILRNA